MPINDSAGVGVYLIDKSQRSSATIGFRSAGAIEADRGLCNKPQFISSEADYVKVFGTPSMERHGLAAMEAYMLAQRKVPQVLVRAKNPELTNHDSTFGKLKFSLVEKGGRKELVVEEGSPATAIAAPAESDADTAMLYFKGEGTYCSKDSGNVVVRISEPVTQSAYAKENHSIRVQVFDFDGAPHIDEDKEAVFAFNPDLSTIINNEGMLKLDGYKVACGDIYDSATGKVIDLKASAFVNGCMAKTADGYDYRNISTDCGLFDLIKDVICQAHTASNPDKPIIDPAWLNYVPRISGSDNGVSDVLDGYEGCYVLMDESADRQPINAFGLSIKIAMDITDVPIYDDTRKVTPGFFAFSCGSVTITNKGDDFNTVWGTKYAAKFSISTSFYLKNRNDYMFMGDQNKDWASYYNTYCKVDKVVSLSYDDYDANYISMQMDAVLNSNDYLVPKSSETFGDYSIDYGADGITQKLHYFTGDIIGNAIPVEQKSFAYSTALQILLGDNLTRWRCLATPNLGDVMNVSDYLSAIDSAGECTLGLSNIGRAAAMDVFNNLTGRHGNRFIADYSQYAYRTLAGKRTAVTMACVVDDLLNSHYNAGLEARPPMGYNYGEIACLSVTQEFSGSQRSMLVNQYKINPVIEDGGFFLWGEKTSQLTDTSLSDIHVIISYIWIKFAIYDAMKAFVAEYNDQSTVNRGLTVLNQLNQTFITKKYIEEGKVDADKNVIGDEVLRFDYHVRFKGVAKFVDVYVTAHSQTQTLAVSLAMEA